MTRFAFLLPFIVACSSSPQTSQNDSGLPREDAAAPDGDAAIPQKDAGSITDAIADVSSNDAGDPFTPHPPAGTTKCGSGAINAGTAQSTCSEPSFVLDDAPQVDGGTGPMPRACDALTVGAGEWQVWCSATTAYVWARIPVTNANALTDCHGVSLLMIDEGIYAFGNGGGNGAQVATYEADGTEIAGTTPGDPQTIIASTTFTTTSIHGDATLWIAGSLEDTCNNAIFDPPTVLTGFESKW